MSKPYISVVIPVYKDLKGLKDTLKSLRSQSIGIDSLEIIVVNDGGDKQINTFCEKEGLAILNIIPNKGSYNARNEGSKISSSSNIAFIDADIIADKNWAMNGLKHLEQYDYVAGDVQILKEYVVDIATFHDSLVAFPIRRYFDDVGFGVTGNLFIRKILLKKIGDFDQRLKSGGDFEFGRRVRDDITVKRLFAEDCVVYHRPRNHRQKVIKMKRVKQGHKKLKELYGDRFQFLDEKKSLYERVRLFFPPSLRSVNMIYQSDKRFTRWKLLLYMYKLQLIKSINGL